jgi:hypothetical protein
MEFDKIYLIDVPEKKIKRAFLLKDLAILEALKLKIELDKIQEIDFNETDDLDYDRDARGQEITILHNYGEFKIGVNTTIETDSHITGYSYSREDIIETTYQYHEVENLECYDVDIDGLDFSEEFKDKMDLYSKWICEELDQIED